MFIPFLAAAISAATFSKLGALSVQVAVMSGALTATVAIIIALAAYIMWHLAPLHAKIGQLTLENDFLERALTKAGLLSARR